MPKRLAPQWAVATILAGAVLMVVAIALVPESIKRDFEESVRKSAEGQKIKAEQQAAERRAAEEQEARKCRH